MAENVKRIAKLAMLDLTEEEAVLYEKQFSEILEMVKQLDGVDTSSVEETQNKAIENLREDIVLKPADTKLFWQNAPDKEFNLLKVKKVL